MLCGSCSAVQCRERGTPDEQLEVECPSCGGEGCDKCDESGSFLIDGCPNEYCRGIVSTVECIDLFEKGMAPVAGGTLDQSAWFLAAVKTLRYDESIIKAERYGKRHS